MFATKEYVNGTFEILCYRTPRGDRLKWDTRAYFGTYIITREYLIHGTSDDGSLSYRVAYNLIEPWYSADVCVFERFIRPKSLLMSYESTNTPFSLSIRSTRGHIRERYEDTPDDEAHKNKSRQRSRHDHKNDTTATMMATMNDHGNDERSRQRWTIMAAITITTRISWSTRLQGCKAHEVET